MRRFPVLALMSGPVILIALAGCAADPLGGAGDAPIARVEQDGWTILNNVDDYTNVAFRCFGPNGVYVPRNEAPMVVVPDDPICKPGEGR